MEGEKIPVQKFEEQEESIDIWNIPEIIKGEILKKATDVFEYGTAFTVLLGKEIRGTLGSVLKNGVLGVERGLENSSKGVDNEKIKEEWVDLMKERKNTAISFNIMGRSFDVFDPIKIGGESVSKYGARSFAAISDLLYGENEFFNEVKQKKLRPTLSEVWSKHLKDADDGLSVAVLFSLDGVKEIEPQFIGDGQEEEPASQNNTFRIRAPKGWVGKEKNQRGDLCVGDMYGFSFSSRVAPRRFKGLVINDVGFLEQVVKTMLEEYKDNPAESIPIYDTKGDMIWPKKIRRGQIEN